MQDEQTPATLASLRRRNSRAGRTVSEKVPLQSGLLFAEPAPGLEMNPAALPTGSSRRIWSVQALVSEVRRQIEPGFADIWVEGEISNCRSAPSGHIYFTLKDGEAQLSVVLFRRQAMLLRFRPEDGMAVLVRGNISIYEGRGQLQLIAETLEPRGAGALQIAFEQLKTKLQAEGLFDTENKRPLPAFPKTIGVITSPSGAVIRDILNICARRNPNLSVLLYPAAMQGENCAAEVIAGLQFFNAQLVASATHADLIIIARGGGSIEDLAGFNDEALAREIAASELPVVSAIGHETDFTIADFVADLRAPTPSAAAELVTEAQHRVEEHIAQLSFRMSRACRYQLLHARQRLAELSADSVFARLQDGFGRKQQRVDELRYRIESAWSLSLERRRQRLAHARERLSRQDVARRVVLIKTRHDALRQRLEFASAHLLRNSLERHSAAQTRLHALSPLAVLQRGYALVFDERGRLLKAAKNASEGSTITARLAQGELSARVLNRK